MTDVLRDFMLFNGADRMVGRIDDFQPPTLKIMTEEFRAAGMDAPMDIDLGMSKLEAGWTTSGVERSMYEGFGVIIGIPTVVMVRGAALNVQTGIPKPIVHTLGGKIVEIAPGAWKPGERSTLAVKMSLTHYKLTHTLPGVPLVEIDVPNGIRIINAVDQLLAMHILVGR